MALHQRFILAVAALSVLGGCAMDAAEDAETVGRENSAVIADNALSANGLPENGLVANALAANALAQNALAQNGLADHVALSRGDEAGHLSRQFLRYAAGCALDWGQCISFDGPGGQEYACGQLGYGRHWEWQALTDDWYAMRKVSACIAARVNWFNKPVTISIADYGSGGDDPYIWNEGGFAADLFSSAPWARSCTGQWAWHAYFYDRVCTTQDCGLIKMSNKSCDALAAEEGPVLMTFVN